MHEREQQLERERRQVDGVPAADHTLPLHVDDEVVHAIADLLEMRRGFPDGFDAQLQALAGRSKSSTGILSDSAAAWRRPYSISVPAGFDRSRSDHATLTDGAGAASAWPAPRPKASVETAAASQGGRWLSDRFMGQSSCDHGGFLGRSTVRDPGCGVHEPGVKLGDDLATCAQAV